jgi:quinol monooxygenase YgiN
MFVVTVAFRSVPDRAADFLAALRENAATSLRDEPGCHRFDVCTDPDDPKTLFLYELYTDADAFEAHKASRHFLAFDALVRDWTAEKIVKIWMLDTGTSA